MHAMATLNFLVPLVTDHRYCVLLFHWVLHSSAANLTRVESNWNTQDKFFEGKREHSALTYSLHASKLNMVYFQFYVVSYRPQPLQCISKSFSSALLTHVTAENQPSLLAVSFSLVPTPCGYAVKVNIKVARKYSW